MDRDVGPLQFLHRKGYSSINAKACQSSRQNRNKQTYSCENQILELKIHEDQHFTSIKVSSYKGPCLCMYLTCRALVIQAVLVILSIDIICDWNACMGVNVSFQARYLFWLSELFISVKVCWHLVVKLGYGASLLWSECLTPALKLPCRTSLMIGQIIVSVNQITMHLECSIKWKQSL